MNTKKRIKVLVVDDEKIIRDFLVRLLSLEAVEVKAAEDGLKAINLAKQEEFNLVFIDVRMPYMDGLETLRELKKINPNAKYVMITGYAVDDLLEEAKREGASVSIKKPFEIGEILDQIKNLD